MFNFIYIYIEREREREREREDFFFKIFFSIKMNIQSKLKSGNLDFS